MTQPRAWLRWSRRCGALAALLALSGCVERIMKITTDPPGARVILNDEEVGRSPVKTSFLWYGDYEIILRKEGYETMRTNYRVDPPWYQIPPLDLVSETLVIGTIRDEHTLPTYTLQPTSAPAVEAVVGRAVQLREQALFQK
jgi:hypothetical protein